MCENANANVQQAILHSEQAQVFGLHSLFFKAAYSVTMNIFRKKKFSF